MNVFEAVKGKVTTRQAAEIYGIQVNRHGMAVCPFHNDKNPSMKLDIRFHYFSCQADRDAVDFVSHLFGLSSKEAAMKLADDFSIPYDARKEPSVKPKIRAPPPRNRDTIRKKTGASRCCPITSIISEHRSSNTHQSSRRMNGILCSWKPCKEKAMVLIWKKPITKGFYDLSMFPATKATRFYKKN